MTRIAGHEFFSIGHDHLHRTTCGLGKKITKRDIHHRALAAEIAPHSDHVDPDTIPGEIQLLGELLFKPEGSFAGGPDFNPI
jgi:hypothetical protein